MLFLLTVFFLISISSTLLYLLLSVFVLKSILSDISIVTPAFFGFLFTWNIFFHLSLLVCVSLHLPGITCRYESGGSCFSFIIHGLMVILLLLFWPLCSSSDALLCSCSLPEFLLFCFSLLCFHFFIWLWIWFDFCFVFVLWLP